MSGRVPSCYGSNIIDKSQLSKYKPVSCIGGKVSLTGLSPRIVPISVIYPGANCTPSVGGCCKTSCYYR